MPRNLSQDHEVNAARDEPERFLGPLLQHHRSMLRRVARRRLNPRLRTRVDTSDIVQQTLVEAWQSWPGFMGTSRGQIVNWLKTVLNRVVFRESRRRQLNREHWHVESTVDVTAASQLSDDNSRNPADEAAFVEQTRLLRSALEQLSDAQRQVIILRHFHGLQFAEIATLTSPSAAAARMVYIRGIMRLRQILATNHERDQTSLD